MKFLKVSFLTALALASPQLFRHEAKIPPKHTDITYNANWQTPDNLENIQEILNQPYTYLANGNQATVFQSEDGKYVVKLIRYPRSIFPWIQSAKFWVAKNIRKKKLQYSLYEKVDKTCKAAKIALVEGSAFTQVIYCHLNLTRHQLPITTFKTPRKNWNIPLDQYRFVVQKKVTPFNQALIECKNDPVKMQQHIDSLINLLYTRSAKGIRNTDPNLATNFGFLNGQAVEIDFGNYGLPAFDPVASAKEVSNFLARFEDWLNKYAPKYSQYLTSKKRLAPQAL